MKDNLIYASYAVLLAAIILGGCASASPPMALRYYNRGLENLDSGNLETAIGFFNKAILEDPNFFPAYHKRGLAKGGLGKYEEAEEDFDKAKELQGLPR